MNQPGVPGGRGGLRPRWSPGRRRLGRDEIPVQVSTRPRCWAACLWQRRPFRRGWRSRRRLCPRLIAGSAPPWGGRLWPPGGVPGVPTSSAGPSEPARLRLGSGRGAGDSGARSPPAPGCETRPARILPRAAGARTSPEPRFGRGRAPGGVAVPPATSLGRAAGRGGCRVRGAWPSPRGCLCGFPGEGQAAPRPHKVTDPPGGGPVPRTVLLPRVGSPGEVGARRGAELSVERSPRGEQASLLGGGLPWGRGSAVTSCAHAGGSSARAVLPGLGPARRGGGTAGSVRGQRGGFGRCQMAAGGSPCPSPVLRGTAPPALGSGCAQARAQGVGQSLPRGWGPPPCPAGWPGSV